MIHRALADHPEVVALMGVYVLTLLVSVPSLWGRWNAAATVLLVAAFLGNTAVLADRWIEAGRPPFKTLFETMIFYPWCVALVALLLIGLYRLVLLVPFAAAISLAGLGYALARPDVEVVNLPPALQSAWFIPHVVTYFVSYAALFASAVLAFLAIVVPRRRADPDALPVENPLETYTHRAAILGFALLTGGLIMGAIWGKVAWGDYWSWDPKENWALVTWLAYLVYLHLRFAPGWTGRRAMAVCLVAFFAVVFTYLGMSILPTAEGSLHVYQ